MNGGWSGDESGRTPRYLTNTHNSATSRCANLYLVMSALYSGSKSQSSGLKLNDKIFQSREAFPFSVSCANTAGEIAAKVMFELSRRGAPEPHAVADRHSVAFA
jgi:hypothetical protein